MDLPVVGATRISTGAQQEKVREMRDFEPPATSPTHHHRHHHLYLSTVTKHQAL